MPKIVSDLECTFNSFALLQKILIFDGVFDGHGVKAGTVFRDPGPPQSLKVEPPHLYLMTSFFQNFSVNLKFLSFFK